MICATFPGNDSINELWTNCFELNRGSDEMYHRTTWSIIRVTAWNSLRLLESKYDCGPLLAHTGILRMYLDCESRITRISRWINWRSRWLRGRCGTRPRSTICGRTGIEVPRRRPLVISRKLPLPVEMLESISHARGTNAWGKEVIARALSAMRVSYFSLSFSLCFCRDAANWKWDLVPCKADRSRLTLCLWRRD